MHLPHACITFIFFRCSRASLQYVQLPTVRPHLYMNAAAPLYDQLVEQCFFKRSLVIPEAPGKVVPVAKGPLLHKGPQTGARTALLRTQTTLRLASFCLWLSLQLESPNLLFPVCF
jgi:hypothetical protein